NAGGMPRAGHIPGARNVPYTSLLEPGGKLKPAAALRTLLNANGPPQPALSVSYCHIGQQATVLYFAARYLGLDARLYDGSLQDWRRPNDLPVEPAASLDAIFAPLIDSKAPGAALLVRRDGTTLVKRAYGVRDLRSAAAIDDHTDFRLASFTKQFTAM